MLCVDYHPQSTISEMPAYPNHSHSDLDMAQGQRRMSVPWELEVPLHNGRPQPWFTVHNNIYLAMSAQGKDCTEFVAQYWREKELIQQAVDLRDGVRTPPLGGGFNPPPKLEDDTDPGNTTVFIGGLHPHISGDLLTVLFLPFGDILQRVNTPTSKNCAFARFQDKESARNAIRCMQGFVVDGVGLRTSWGRPSKGGSNGASTGGSNGSLNPCRSNDSAKCSPGQLGRVAKSFDAQQAQAILTAWDSIFNGDSEKFRYGLEFACGYDNPSTQNAEHGMVSGGSGSNGENISSSSSARTPSPEFSGDQKRFAANWTSHACAPQSQRAYGLGLNAAAPPFKVGCTSPANTGKKNEPWSSYQPAPTGPQSRAFDPFGLDHSPVSNQESISSEEPLSSSFSLSLSDLSLSPPPPVQSTQKTRATDPYGSLLAEQHEVSTMQSHHHDPDRSLWIPGPGLDGDNSKTTLPPNSVGFGPIGRLAVPSGETPSSGTITPSSQTGQIGRNRLAHQHQPYRQPSYYYPSTSVPTRPSDIAAISAMGLDLGVRRISDPMPEAPTAPARYQHHVFGLPDSNMWQTNGRVRGVHPESNEAFPGVLLGGNSVFSPSNRR